MTSKLPSHRAASFKGHSGPIHALTYSSGAGQYLLSGSSDRTIKLWNPSKAVATNDDASNALVQSYSGAHGYEVLSIAVATDNARFVSSGGDKLVFLWDVSTTRTLRRFGGGATGGHGGKIECVVFGGDGDSVVISSSFDATVRLWDTKAQGNRPMMVLSDAKDSVTSLCVHGSEIWAGSVDGRLRAYDLRTGTCHEDVIAYPITSLTATRQGDSLLVSTLESKLRLMDVSNGKCLQEYSDASYTNKTYRTRSTLGANDSLVIAGSEDGWIYAWDVLSGNLVNRLTHSESSRTEAPGSRNVVSAVAYKKRTQEWSSAAGDGTTTDTPEYNYGLATFWIKLTGRKFFQLHKRIQRILVARGKPLLPFNTFEFPKRKTKHWLEKAITHARLLVLLEAREKAVKFSMAVGTYPPMSFLAAVQVMEKCPL